MIRTSIGSAISFAKVQLAKARQSSGIWPASSDNVAPNIKRDNGKLASPSIFKGSYATSGIHLAPKRKTVITEKTVATSGWFKKEFSLKSFLKFFDKNAGTNPHMVRLNPIKNKKI